MLAVEKARPTIEPLMKKPGELISSLTWASVSEKLIELEWATFQTTLTNPQAFINSLVGA